MKILAVFIMAIISLSSSSKVNTSGNNSTPGSSSSKDGGIKCICNQSCHGSGSKQEISELVKTVAKMDESIIKMAQNITNMHTKIDNLHPANVSNGKDCADLYKKGHKLDGVYTVNPDGQGDFKVYCDQTTSGGGWLIFQRRLDGSVDFYRGWNDYKNGFGDVTGEYWLGLDRINRLTRLRSLRLRVDLQDTLSNAAYEEYENFAVASEKTNYKLAIGKHKGTAGDSMSTQYNRAFSTKDRDNDVHRSSCAEIFKGAWWYDSCHDSNLNGLYHLGEQSSYADGVNWKTWKGLYYSAKLAEMKIRPMNY